LITLASAVQRFDWAQKFKWVTWPRPFHGSFVIQGLWLAILIKLEVSISIHYEDMKGDTKREKRGGLGLEVTQGHWK